MKKYDSIDEYIQNYPQNIQTVLQKLRQTIQKAAPEAKEAISYGIPTFKFHGNLVHFGAFKDHISFFPTSSPAEVFKKELLPYATTKGTIKFPLGAPIPFALVTKIVKFRVQENLERKNKKK